MRRIEAIALGVAVGVHVVLFVLLSIIRSDDEDVPPPPKPIDISLIDEVALVSSAPVAVDAPATSIAPDSGPPEDAAPPVPVDTPPDPAPIARVDTPAPKPAPQPKPKPKPPEPPARKVEKKPEPPRKTAPTKAATKPGQTGSNPKSRQIKPTGARLGPDFLKGVVGNDSPGKGQTPRAEAVSSQSAANLASAIQRQVQPCANKIPNPGPGANAIRSRIRLQMSPDGTMRARPELRGQTGVDDGNRRYAQRVAELATAAFIQCAPYELPAELYENGWKDIIINYKLPG